MSRTNQALLILLTLLVVPLSLAYAQQGTTEVTRGGEVTGATISDDGFPEPLAGDTPPVGGPLGNENVYAYPNPFNPEIESVNFRFRLARDGSVTVKVYDVSSTLVNTINTGSPMVAGEELQVTWNGRNGRGIAVANGVYFYVIESGSGGRAVGKVAVLR